MATEMGHVTDFLCQGNNLKIGDISISQSENNNFNSAPSLLFTLDLDFWKSIWKLKGKSDMQNI